MKIWLLFFTCLWLTSSLLAQTPLFAPGLQWSESLKSYIGLHNTQATAQTYQVTGFDADGTVVGTQSLNLAANARTEFAAPTLFDVAQVAWVRIDAAIAPAGYVRLARAAGDYSLSPLNRFSSNRAYLAEPIAVEGLKSWTTLTQVGEAGGVVRLSPVNYFSNQPQALREETDLQIAGLASAGSQVTFAHGEYYNKPFHRVSWDVAQGDENTRLVAQQFFGEFSGSGPLASLTLPASSNRYMIFASPFSPTDSNYWQKMVLVNTNNSPLKYRITAQVFGQAPIIEDRILNPYEKQELKFNDPVSFPFAGWIEWLQLETSEDGLAAFQVIGDKAGKFLSTHEAVAYPANVLDFPLVQLDSSISSKLVLINTQTTTTSCLFYAYDAAGVKLKTYSAYIKPNVKTMLSLEEMFGSAVAPSVASVRAVTRLGNLVGWISLLKKDGSGFSMLQAQPQSAYRGEVFYAGFEHFDLEEMLEKGWHELRFGQPPQGERETTSQKTYTTNCFGGDTWPGPGTFFLEFAYPPHDGERFLSYGPIDFNRRGRPLDASDAVAMVSPYFEVPAWGDFYLSYWARFLDPARATVGSHYGMMVREEGGDHWYYFGVNGRVFTEHNVGFNDNLVDVYYACLILPMNSYWVPYQMKLPAEFKGKRIQVAYFYDHRPADYDMPGPIMFLDEIRVSADLIPHAVFLPEDGFDVFEWPPAAQ